MEDESVPPEFWDRADAIIALANEQLNESTVGKVSASLLYAVARFNSFNVANSAENVAEMKADKETAIKYFMEQYQKVLEENIDDYIENFADYITHDKNS